MEVWLKWNGEYWNKMQRTVNRMIKKGQTIVGWVRQVDFPAKGIVQTEEGHTVIVKNTIPNQKVCFLVNKIRKGTAEGRLLCIVEPSPEEVLPPCPHFGSCGGCVYQSISYDHQLALKEGQVFRLLEEILSNVPSCQMDPIQKSPVPFEYRNKMEFTFGDAYKDGPLALGMHMRGNFYDIVTVSGCRIVDADFRAILRSTLDFFQTSGEKHYHRMRHEGYLRHLMVRKAKRTGEILVTLVTSSQFSNPNARYSSEEEMLMAWSDCLKKQSYQGILQGILHTRNDSTADAVINEGTVLLYGAPFFYEELLGLRFQITPFSFFQTNSLGAEVLYRTVRELIQENTDLSGRTVFDLYSGTGTIAQMLAPVCRKVIGVEIVEEAVEAARQNAERNGLKNCEFLTGDVLKVLDTITERPDYIVLDPPRDGIHPKAIHKIIDYGVEHMVYISCKPTSLARDLPVFLERGYVPERICCVDMFPWTANVETVVLLSQQKPDDGIEVNLDAMIETIAAHVKENSDGNNLAPHLK